ncbi:hypothetical protein ABZ023_30805 [Streptomyces sp. NPDC006367]|uniref:hypothetical protein n=1 Tax=unclassified Streptomyces TaxID=2593676 RepID=UPI0033BCC72F
MYFAKYIVYGALVVKAASHPPSYQPEHPVNLAAALSDPEGADASPPAIPGLYALYAERDGIAVGWEFCDALATPGAARALLPDVRRELATLNASGHFHGTSCIHLLRHAAAGCDCLTTEAPAEGCRVLETFAPNEAASGQDDESAAKAWGAAAAAKEASVSAATPAMPHPGIYWDD